MSIFKRGKDKQNRGEKDTPIAVTGTQANSPKLDPTSLLYRIGNTDCRWDKIHEKTVEISELLFTYGFSFCSAYTAGGVTEISHTGYKAYDGEYFNFQDYKDYFDSDYRAESQMEEESGWASFLDYSSIGIHLKKQNVRIYCSVDGDRTALVRVYGYDGSVDIEAIVEDIRQTLGANATIKEEPQFKEEPILEFEAWDAQWWEDEKPSRRET